MPNQVIESKSGTSFAAPHVSGTAALVLSVNPSLRVAEVNYIIEKTSQKVGNYTYSNNSNRPNGTWNNEMGYGLVDTYAAVQLAQQFVSPQLTGDYNICNTPSKTYSISNGGSNVTWQVSSNLSIVGPPTNTQITVKALNSNSTGNSYIKAVLPYQTITKDLWVGASSFHLERDLPYGGVNGDNPNQFCKSFFFGFDNHITIINDGGLTTEYEVEKISNNFNLQQTFSSIVIQPHTVGIMSLRARVKNGCGWSSWKYYQYEIVDCGGSGFPGGFSILSNPITSNTLMVTENVDNEKKSKKRKGETVKIELYNFTGTLLKTKEVKRKLIEKKYQVEISEIRNGKYFLKIISGNFNEIYQVIINKK